MKRLKYWLMAVVFAAGVGGSAVPLLAPATVSAACDTRFLTFPTWYRGLVDENCNVKPPSDKNQSKQSLSEFIWTIALNIVEIMLHIVGYVAVGYLIYGGFVYLTSTGQPDRIQGAKRSITNAIVGLIISVFAIAIVNVVVGAF